SILKLTESLTINAFAFGIRTWNPRHGTGVVASNDFGAVAAGHNSTGPDVFRRQIEVKVENLSRVLAFQETHFHSLVVRRGVSDVDVGVLTIFYGVERIDQGFTKAISIDVNSLGGTR